MSLFEKIGAAVGIGACKVQVALNASQVGWGETISGEVRVCGGTVPQQLDWLKAFLMEHWTTTTTDSKGHSTTHHHYLTHDECQLADDLAVAPSQEHTFAFEMKAPWGRPFSHDWYVQARASIPAAVDRGGQCAFRLVVPAVFSRVAQSLTAASGIPLAYWSVCRNGAAAQFKPQGEQRRVFDGIRLELALEADQIVGTVIVNPQEHSLMDVLKSFVHADRVRLPVRLSADDAEAGREQFEEIIRKFRIAMPV
jgi:sporulation-control protein spo0M